MAKTILNEILRAGVDAGASDWHIREGSTVGLRIAAELTEMKFVTQRAFLEQAILDVVPPIQREIFQNTGDADFAFAEEGIGRFRANLHKQRGLLSLSLRFVKGVVPTRQELGLPEIVTSIAHSKRGIVFVTGTTGSGKSTTLACMVDMINVAFHRHIVTIEDPIEYTFVDKNCIIEQREVGLDCISYEAGMIHVLRQDPDVIVIGEMRHRSTFEVALTAAETGHLVLSTLHTTTAPQAILRILDMFAHSERDSVRKSLASSLNSIICQRLIPTASGKDVTPAVEIMLNTPIVTKLIGENRLERLSTAIESSGEDGMVSFNRSLLNLVNEGRVTEEVAMEYSNNPEALQMNLRGIFLSSDGAGLVGEA